ncbi:MAG: site-specific DNA-methyltransferase [Pseudanabaena sp. ELA607]
MAPKKTTTPKSTSIDSVKHKDKRANIPTEELRDFVADEERTPKKLTYPRDPSLDPQLVWRGKDDQDTEDLEIPVVPIYIQEKIHPHAIIEDFRASSQQSQPEQLGLFSDFNGLDFDKFVDFYKHLDGVKWTNRMILGDSLLVMASLAEKEGLRGKVQTIYLDPPYGIKFGSNWQVSTRKRDVKDGSATDVTRQPEQVKAFRDTWQLGVNSYLSYLRDRLVIARDLLTETGSVFVQIGDENVHLVRCLMDEVFGSENFVSEIIVVKSSGLGSNLLPRQNDFILMYAKNSERVKYRQIFKLKSLDGEGASAYQYLKMGNGHIRPLSREEIDDPQLIPANTSPLRFGDLTKPGPGSKYDFEFQGQVFTSKGRWWGMPKESLERAAKADRIFASKTTVSYQRLLTDWSGFPLTNIWTDTGTGSGLNKIYVVQTDDKIIQRCILMTTDTGDLVLDPTCGSGTTAYVAEQWGRRWITIDTSRVALALARTRLMSAKFSYYLLADSPEGIAKEAEITGILSPINETQRDIRRGFVYKRVPHVTLKSIANNAEIDTIHEKWQAQLEPIRTQINQLTKQNYEEWQIPRETDAKWSEPAKKLLAQWWELRQKRQREIDGSISRHAETEILYDQPYEDNKRVRVTGPFTVESLSPHRILSDDAEQPSSTAIGTQQATDDFETRIIENLRKAGVQNTVKQERLKFDSLETYAGTWIHATGEYTDADDKVKRVAISLGAEYGTVGTEQIKEAAKEAVQGLGYDLLIVCGFAFDPSVQEESKRYGKLQVLITRMNPDLLLSDELLKKTGSGNLFMVFGEPDIAIDEQNGKLTVTLKGLDIYDPTTGEIRSNSTNDIACWFIDTNYNGESFFVRHAYFTGADQPYEKLKRALKAEIDESAWSELYTTTSRAFDKPISHNGKKSKIAIKVINHYGDEVLKVYEV